MPENQDDPYAGGVDSPGIPLEALEAIARAEAQIVDELDSVLGHLHRMTDQAWDSIDTNGLRNVASAIEKMIDAKIAIALRNIQED